MGPPCTVERGDTVLLDVDWNNPGIGNMTQSTVWVTGSWGVELPWIGMETEGCPFLDEGTGCRPDSKVCLRGGGEIYSNNLDQSLGKN